MPSPLVLERVTALIERKEELELGTYSATHSTGLCYLVSGSDTSAVDGAPASSRLLQLAKYNNHLSLLQPTLAWYISNHIPSPQLQTENSLVW